MRNVTIDIDQENHAQLAMNIQHTLTRAVETAIKEDDKTTYRRLKDQGGFERVQYAIGKLALWSLTTPDPDYPDAGYTHCRISIADVGDSGQPELVAVYTDERDETKRYVIGAIWHGTEWGFHS